MPDLRAVLLDPGGTLIRAVLLGEKPRDGVPCIATLRELPRAPGLTAAAREAGV